MKFAITIITITILSFSTFSAFAQASHNDFENVNFGASAQAETPTQTKKIQSAFKVGHFAEAGEFQLFVPLNFSPNGDGYDDNLQIETTGVLSFEFMLFDQWGGFQFSSNDANLNWDGAVNGKNLRPGMYVYTVKVTTLDGKVKKNSGSIIIEQ